ncbi:MAG: nuclear transport factor 2 family protein [Bacteroidota bacterium]|nr:nuclear transport factor 2 family protein [Bacteroidota bacterium]
MKKSIIILSSLFIFFCTHAQNAAETEILKLENDQKEAYLKKDTATLIKLYSAGFVVNSPSNKVETFQDLLFRMRKGERDREAYERIIEKITFANDIAIVMGNETIKPTGIATNAGKTVKRRYTNIWMRNEKSWQLVARQSTIISVE